MRFLILAISLISFSSIGEATILACSDRIEKVKDKKEKEGPGDLGNSVCKKSKNKKARYKEGTGWKCETVQDFPCVEKKNLKMVQCDREWECY